MGKKIKQQQQNWVRYKHLAAFSERIREMIIVLDAKIVHNPFILKK